jgi:hypothetical protein
MTGGLPLHAFIEASRIAGKAKKFIARTFLQADAIALFS